MKLSDFNMRIGYPLIMDIEAGKEDFKYIEINDPDSIIYIGFALLAYDINFKLLKYKAVKNQTDEPNFETCLSVEKINACQVPVKIIAFASEPGVYKAVWDNTYSWMNAKNLRIRIAVLRASELFKENSIEKNVSNENIQIIDQQNENKEKELEKGNVNENKNENKERNEIIEDAKIEVEVDIKEEKENENKKEEISNETLVEEETNEKKKEEIDIEI